MKYYSQNLIQLFHFHLFDFALDLILVCMCSDIRHEAAHVPAA